METARKLLITVGTTEFDELLEKLDNELFLDSLQKFGFKDILIQRGRGSYRFHNIVDEGSGVDEWTGVDRCGIGIKFRIIRFHDDLSSLIQWSSFVIGHAGAGTILDVLCESRPILVVVNHTLQGNHQEELAKAIGSHPLCGVSHCDTFLGNFIKQNTNVSHLSFDEHSSALPILQADKFAGFLNQLLTGS